ncbi:hypothetical protein NFHSH190041_37170 (plasmid) [Shewanella sp. NFH-SH190041]|nr:hypothetical protein NFHSH190041_37170 [Shewanella sp. NFH-SH190041]
MLALRDVMRDIAGPNSLSQVNVWGLLIVNIQQCPLAQFNQIMGWLNTGQALQLFHDGPPGVMVIDLSPECYQPDKSVLS